MPTILVGVDVSDRSRDAVAFARILAGATGARLLLATVHPPTPFRLGPGAEGARHAAAGRAVGDVRAEAGDGAVATRAIAGHSPARALVDLADREDVALIVIGSSARGGLGRVCAGTLAERLLHAAPCPVAVVPRDFRLRAGGLHTVLAGTDGSAEARVAVDSALELAKALGAAIRIVRVLRPRQGRYAGCLGSAVTALPTVTLEEIEREERASFEADMAALGDGAHADTRFMMGDPVRELRERSEVADVLVLGSRGRGPRAAAVFGSVSGRLVREAGCPVIAVPRGARAGLEALAGEARIAA